MNSVFIFFLNCIIILKEENLHDQLQAKPYVIEQTEHILFSAAAWSQKIFKRGVHKMKRQDHRARVTDLLLRRALTGLLRQKPIQSISVQELCQAAGISRGTFYAHYQDLYALREQLEGELLREFRQALEPLLAAEGGDLTPLKVTTGVFQCLQANADICIMTLGPFGDKKFAARLINLGRERCLETYLRFFAGATPRQIEFYYAFVSAGCIGLLEKWLDEGMAGSAGEIAGMAEDIMMYGMGFLQRGPTR